MLLGCRMLLELLDRWVLGTARGCWVVRCCWRCWIVGYWVLREAVELLMLGTARSCWVVEYWVLREAVELLMLEDCVMLLDVDLYAKTRTGGWFAAELR